MFLYFMKINSQIQLVATKTTLKLLQFIYQETVGLSTVIPSIPTAQGAAKVQDDK